MRIGGTHKIESYYLKAEREAALNPPIINLFQLNQKWPPLLITDHSLFIFRSRPSAG